MPNSQLLPVNNSVFLHPILSFSDSESEQEKAKKLKDFLIGLSKTPEVKDYRSILRQCADSVREKAFGISDKKIESKLREAFEDYFDGHVYNFVEMTDLEELTGLSERVIAPILEKMIGKGIVESSQRRRWNEPGKHYNPMYRKKK